MATNPKIRFRRTRSESVFKTVAIMLTLILLVSAIAMLVVFLGPNSRRPSTPLTTPTNLRITEEEVSGTTNYFATFDEVPNADRYRLYIYKSETAVDERKPDNDWDFSRRTVENVTAALDRPGTYYFAIQAVSNIDSYSSGRSNPLDCEFEKRVQLDTPQLEVVEDGAGVHYSWASAGELASGYEIDIQVRNGETSTSILDEVIYTTGLTYTMDEETLDRMSEEYYTDFEVMVRAVSDSTFVDASEWAVESYYTTKYIETPTLSYVYENDKHLLRWQELDRVTSYEIWLLSSQRAEAIAYTIERQEIAGVISWKVLIGNVLQYTIDNPVITEVDISGALNPVNSSGVLDTTRLGIHTVYIKAKSNNPNVVNAQSNLLDDIEIRYQLNKPTGLSAQTSGLNVVISWSAVEYAKTYHVYISNKAGQNVLTSGEFIVSGSTSFTGSQTLNPAGYYAIRVVAVTNQDFYDNSDLSNEKVLEIETQLAAPANLRYTQNPSGAATLAWNSVSYSNGYLVDIYQLVGTGEEQVKTEIVTHAVAAGTTSLSLNTLKDGEGNLYIAQGGTYYFRVMAKGGLTNTIYTDSEYGSEVEGVFKSALPKVTGVTVVGDSLLWNLEEKAIGYQLNVNGEPAKIGTNTDLIITQTKTEDGFDLAVNGDYTISVTGGVITLSSLATYFATIVSDTYSLTITALATGSPYWSDGETSDAAYYQVFHVLATPVITGATQLGSESWSNTMTLSWTTDSNTNRCQVLVNGIVVLSSDNASDNIFRSGTNWSCDIGSFLTPGQNKDKVIVKAYSNDSLYASATSEEFQITEFIYYVQANMKDVYIRFSVDNEGIASYRLYFRNDKFANAYKFVFYTVDSSVSQVTIGDSKFDIVGGKVTIDGVEYTYDTLSGKLLDGAGEEPAVIWENIFEDRQSGIECWIDIDNKYISTYGETKFTAEYSAIYTSQFPYQDPTAEQDYIRTILLDTIDVYKNETYLTPVEELRSEQTAEGWRFLWKYDSDLVKYVKWFGVAYQFVGTTTGGTAIVPTTSSMVIDGVTWYYTDIIFTEVGRVEISFIARTNDDKKANSVAQTLTMDVAVVLNAPTELEIGVDPINGLYIQFLPVKNGTTYTLLLEKIGAGGVVLASFTNTTATANTNIDGVNYVRVYASSFAGFDSGEMATYRASVKANAHDIGEADFNGDADGNGYSISGNIVTVSAGEYADDYTLSDSKVIIGGVEYSYISDKLWMYYYRESDQTTSEEFEYVPSLATPDFKIEDGVLTIITDVVLANKYNIYIGTENDISKLELVDLSAYASGDTGRVFNLKNYFNTSTGTTGVYYFAVSSAQTVWDRESALSSIKSYTYSEKFGATSSLEVECQSYTLTVTWNAVTATGYGDTIIVPGGYQFKVSSWTNEPIITFAFNARGAGFDIVIDSTTYLWENSEIIAEGTLYSYNLAGMTLLVSSNGTLQFTWKDAGDTKLFEGGNNYKSFMKTLGNSAAYYLTSTAERQRDFQCSLNYISTPTISFVSGEVLSTDEYIETEGTGESANFTIYITNSDYSGRFTVVAKNLMTGNQVVKTNLAGQPAIIGDDHYKSYTLSATDFTPELGIYEISVYYQAVVLYGQSEVSNKLWIYHAMPASGAEEVYAVRSDYGAVNSPVSLQIAIDKTVFESMGDNFTGFDLEIQTTESSPQKTTLALTTLKYGCAIDSTGDLVLVTYLFQIEYINGFDSWILDYNIVFKVQIRGWETAGLDEYSIGANCPDSFGFYTNSVNTVYELRTSDKSAAVQEVSLDDGTGTVSWEYQDSGMTFYYMYYTLNTITGEYTLYYNDGGVATQQLYINDGKLYLDADYTFALTDIENSRTETRWFSTTYQNFSLGDAFVTDNVTTLFGVMIFAATTDTEAGINPSSVLMTSVARAPVILTDADFGEIQVTLVSGNYYFSFDDIFGNLGYTEDRDSLYFLRINGKTITLKSVGEIDTNTTYAGGRVKVNYGTTLGKNLTYSLGVVQLAFTVLESNIAAHPVVATMYFSGTALEPQIIDGPVNNVKVDRTDGNYLVTWDEVTGATLYRISIKSQNGSITYVDDIYKESNNKLGITTNDFDITDYLAAALLPAGTYRVVVEIMEDPANAVSPGSNTSGYATFVWTVAYAQVGLGYSSEPIYGTTGKTIYWQDLLASDGNMVSAKAVYKLEIYKKNGTNLDMQAFNGGKTYAYLAYGETDFADTVDKALSKSGSTLYVSIKDWLDALSAGDYELRITTMPDTSNSQFLASGVATLLIQNSITLTLNAENYLQLWVDTFITGIAGGEPVYGETTPTEVINYLIEDNFNTKTIELLQTIANASGIRLIINGTEVEAHISTAGGKVDISTYLIRGTNTISLQATGDGIYYIDSDIKTAITVTVYERLDTPAQAQFTTGYSDDGSLNKFTLTHGVSAIGAQYEVYGFEYADGQIVGDGILIGTFTVSGTTQDILEYIKANSALRAADYVFRVREMATSAQIANWQLNSDLSAQSAVYKHLSNLKTPVLSEVTVAPVDWESSRTAVTSTSFNWTLDNPLVDGILVYKVLLKDSISDYNAISYRIGIKVTYTGTTPTYQIWEKARGVREGVGWSWAESALAGYFTLEGNTLRFEMIKYINNTEALRSGVAQTVGDYQYQVCVEAMLDSTADSSDLLDLAGKMPNASEKSTDLLSHTHQDIYPYNVTGVKVETSTASPYYGNLLWYFQDPGKTATAFQVWVNGNTFTLDIPYGQRDGNKHEYTMNIKNLLWAGDVLEGANYNDVRVCVVSFSNANYKPNAWVQCAPFDWETTLAQNSFADYSWNVNTDNFNWSLNFNPYFVGDPQLTYGDGSTPVEYQLIIRYSATEGGEVTTTVTLDQSELGTAAIFTLTGATQTTALSLKEILSATALYDATTKALVGGWYRIQLILTGETTKYDDGTLFAVQKFVPAPWELSNALIVDSAGNMISYAYDGGVMIDATAIQQEAWADGNKEVALTVEVKKVGNNYPQNLDLTIFNLANTPLLTISYNSDSDLFTVEDKGSYFLITLDITKVFTNASNLKYTAGTYYLKVKALAVTNTALESEIIADKVVQHYVRLEDPKFSKQSSSIQEITLYWTHIATSGIQQVVITNYKEESGTEVCGSVTLEWSQIKWDNKLSLYYYTFTSESTLGLVKSYNKDLVKNNYLTFKAIAISGSMYLDSIEGSRNEVEWLISATPEELSIDISESRGYSNYPIEGADPTKASSFVMTMSLVKDVAENGVYIQMGVRLNDVLINGVYNAVNTGGVLLWLYGGNVSCGYYADDAFVSFTDDIGSYSESTDDNKKYIITLNSLIDSWLFGADPANVVGATYGVRMQLWYPNARDSTCKNFDFNNFMRLKSPTVSEFTLNGDRIGTQNGNVYIKASDKNNSIPTVTVVVSNVSENADGIRLVFSRAEKDSDEETPAEEIYKNSAVVNKIDGETWTLFFDENSKLVEWIMLYAPGTLQIKSQALTNNDDQELTISFGDNKTVKKPTAGYYIDGNYDADYKLYPSDNPTYIALNGVDYLIKTDSTGRYIEKNGVKYRLNDNDELQGFFGFESIIKRELEHLNWELQFSSETVKINEILTNLYQHDKNYTFVVTPKVFASEYNLPNGKAFGSGINFTFQVSCGTKSDTIVFSLAQVQEGISIMGWLTNFFNDNGIANGTQVEIRAYVQLSKNDSLSSAFWVESSTIDGNSYSAHNLIFYRDFDVGELEMRTFGYSDGTEIPGYLITPSDIPLSFTASDSINGYHTEDITYSVTLTAYGDNTKLRQTTLEVKDIEGAKVMNLANAASNDPDSLFNFDDWANITNLNKDEGAGGWWKVSITPVYTFNASGKSYSVYGTKSDEVIWPMKLKLAGDASIFSFGYDWEKGFGTKDEITGEYILKEKSTVTTENAISRFVSNTANSLATNCYIEIDGKTYDIEDFYNDYKKLFSAIEGALASSLGAEYTAKIILKGGLVASSEKFDVTFAYRRADNPLNATASTDENGITLTPTRSSSFSRYYRLGIVQSVGTKGDELYDAGTSNTMEFEDDLKAKNFAFDPLNCDALMYTYYSIDDFFETGLTANPGYVQLGNNTLRLEVKGDEYNQGYYQEIEVEFGTYEGTYGGEDYKLTGPVLEKIKSASGINVTDNRAKSTYYNFDSAEYVVESRLYVDNQVPYERIVGATSSTESIYRNVAFILLLGLHGGAIFTEDGYLKTKFSGTRLRATMASNVIITNSTYTNMESTVSGWYQKYGEDNNVKLSTDTTENYTTDNETVYNFGFSAVKYNINIDLKAGGGLISWQEDHGFEGDVQSNTSYTDEKKIGEYSREYHMYWGNEQESDVWFIWPVHYTQKDYVISVESRGSWSNRQLVTKYGASVKQTITCKGSIGWGTAAKKEEEHYSNIVYSSLVNTVYTRTIGTKLSSTRGSYWTYVYDITSKVDWSVPTIGRDVGVNELAQTFGYNIY